MKKLILLACLFVIAGCAKQPVIANLNIRLLDQPSGVYSGGTSATISGQDTRKPADVVVFLNDQPALRLANSISPQTLITDRLSAGLREQGLVIDPNSQVRLKYVINELVVKVTRPQVLYSAEAKTFITLTVENKGSVFSKSFNREASKDSATRPDLPDLEGMLNSQLAEIVTLILKDEEVRKLIHKK